MNRLAFSVDSDIGNDKLFRHLGLNPGIFRRLALGSLSEFFRVTPDHSPSAGGTYLYHEAVRALRQLTRSQGYEKRDIGGICFAVNPVRKIAIAVSSGDSDVGQEGGVPQFRYPKGPSSRQALQIVSGQTDFLSHPTMIDVPKVSENQTFEELNGFEIWWWIHFVDLSAKEMRSELSLPAVVLPDGEIKSWQSRILFDALPLDEEPSISFDESTDVHDDSLPTVSVIAREF